MSISTIFNLLASSASGWTVWGLTVIAALSLLFSDRVVTGSRLKKAETDRDRALDLLKISEDQKHDLLTLNMLIAEKMHREVPGSMTPPQMEASA